MATLRLCVAAATATALLLSAGWWRRRRRRPPLATRTVSSVLGLIGDTPLVKLRAISRRTGCDVFGKAEFVNPGGSAKDRVAAAVVEEAEADGALRAGGTLVEATAGSTGISLALVARARGYKCLLVCADDTSEEKMRLIRALGAELEVVRPAGIADPNHAVNVARRRARELGAGSLYCDQYNTLANLRAHERTGVEVWQQTGGAVDAFVMGSGTGGTIAGVSRVLKARKPSVRIVLADPPGSALFHRVKNGVIYTPQQQERMARKNRCSRQSPNRGSSRLELNRELPRACADTTRSWREYAAIADLETLPSALPRRRTCCALTGRVRPADGQFRGRCGQDRRCIPGAQKRTASATSRRGGLSHRAAPGERCRVGRHGARAAGGGEPVITAATKE
jgi:cysteine synthase A